MSIKKLIAREGLIILSIALFSGIVYLLGAFGWLSEDWFIPLFIISIYCFYPAYLLFRFVMWAVKALKQKT